MLLSDTPIASRQTVGMDLFHLKGNVYRMFSDYYSNYSEVVLLANIINLCHNTSNITFAWIRSECAFCSFSSHSHLRDQKMADLPKEKITDLLFEFVGIDYVGPITIKRGSSEMKRQGVIFSS